MHNFMNFNHILAQSLFPPPPTWKVQVCLNFPHIKMLQPLNHLVYPLLYFILAFPYPFWNMVTKMYTALQMSCTIDVHRGILILTGFYPFLNVVSFFHYYGTLSYPLQPQDFFPSSSQWILTPTSIMFYCASLYTYLHLPHSYLFFQFRVILLQLFTVRLVFYHPE